MADIEITVDGGTSKRLLTAGKYCDRNITVTATGGGGPEPPDDGKTRLYITIPANAMEGMPPPRNELPLYIYQSVANGVTIDWGDSSKPETLPGTGYVNTTHVYQEAGDYVISLSPADECELILGNGSFTNCVVGSVSDSDYSCAYRNMLKKVIFGGKGVNETGMNAFRNCNALSSVRISDNITNISRYSFYLCRNLNSVNIPNSVTSIGDYAFYKCIGITSFNIPVGITSLNNDTFYLVNSVCSFVIPYTVNRIQSFSLKSVSLKELYVRPSAPPNNQTTDSIDIPSDCIIYVPVGSLEAYQTATNWSAYADQMQEEPT